MFPAMLVSVLALTHMLRGFALQCGLHETPPFVQALHPFLEWVEWSANRIIRFWGDFALVPYHLSSSIAILPCNDRVRIGVLCSAARNVVV